MHNQLVSVLLSQLDSEVLLGLVSRGRGVVSRGRGLVLLSQVDILWVLVTSLHPQTTCLSDSGIRAISTTRTGMQTHTPIRTRRRRWMETGNRDAEKGRQ